MFQMQCRNAANALRLKHATVTPKLSITQQRHWQLLRILLHPSICHNSKTLIPLMDLRAACLRVNNRIVLLLKRNRVNKNLFLFIERLIYDIERFFGRLSSLADDEILAL